MASGVGSEDAPRRRTKARAVGEKSLGIGYSGAPPDTQNIILSGVSKRGKVLEQDSGCSTFAIPSR
jgi:hypothetical protein